jgi:7,8-dihydroneopterin aldolase/epimerase/oxygenase
MSYTVTFTDFELDASIGFHAFETAARQRVLVNALIELDASVFPAEDSQAAAWDYDFFRLEIFALVKDRHYNLQETFCTDIANLVLAKPGVRKVTITSAKPDVYPDVARVATTIVREKPSA